MWPFTRKPAVSWPTWLSRAAEYMAKNGIAPADIRPTDKWRKAWRRNEDPQDFVFRSYPAVQRHITQQLRRKWRIESGK